MHTCVAGIRKFVLIVACFSVMLSTGKSFAASLEVAVGWTKPPYVLAETDSGFELDLVREVFTMMGYEPHFVYVPYGRTHGMLKAGRVDVTLSLSEKMGIDPQKLSDVYVVYQNVAITKKKDAISLSQISELANYSMVAFQNASFVLGDDYTAASQSSNLYMEVPDQQRQVELLLLGHVQVAVMDINIFFHLSKELTGSSQLGNVDVHYLFPANKYRAGFNNMALKASFNKSLAKFLASDGYYKLKSAYDFHQAGDFPKSAITDQ